MISPDAGRRQADYFRDVLHQELIETQQRVDHLTRRLSDLIERDEAPITVRRAGRALNAAIANGRKVTGMIDALDRSYPSSERAVAS